MIRGKDCLMDVGIEGRVGRGRNAILNTWFEAACHKPDWSHLAGTAPLTEVPASLDRLRAHVIGMGLDS